MMEKDIERIRVLTEQYLAGLLSEEENIELSKLQEEWLNTDPTDVTLQRNFK